MVRATVWMGLYWFSSGDVSPASTARFTSPAYTDRHEFKAPFKYHFEDVVRVWVVLI